MNSCKFIVSQKHQSGKILKKLVLEVGLLETKFLQNMKIFLQKQQILKSAYATHLGRVH